MKIVFLDSYAALPGDLDWTGVEKYGECIFYESTKPEQIIERASDAEIILTNKTPITEKEIKKMPHLRCIGLMITGLNLVDVESAKKYGITITNIPHYSTESVAQMTFSHLLHITMPLGRLSEQVKSGLWQNDYQQIAHSMHQIELCGLTMAIIGLGAIGTRVAEIANGFSMKVLAYTSKKAENLPSFIRKADSLDDLFSQADVLSLHCPLNEETRGIVSAKRIAQMKPSAILLNVSRGGLIDEDALATALNEKRIYAAGVDVLSNESDLQDNPLLSAGNCHITPHMAWNTTASRNRLSQEVKQNLKAFISGQPINTI